VEPERHFDLSFTDDEEREIGRICVFDPARRVIASEGVDVSLGGDLLREPNPTCGTDSTLHVIGLGGTTAN
jgi:hypothetical protein